MKIKTILCVLLAVVMMSGVAMATKKDVIKMTAGKVGEGRAPLVVSGASSIITEDAKVLFDEGAKFIDVRMIEGRVEYGYIPKSILIDVMKPEFTKEALLAEVKLDEKVVFFCSGINCKRSAKASRKALSYGYTKVFYYREGFPGWEKAGYPIKK